MNKKDYSPEFKEKLNECNSAEEVQKLAEENDIELEIDELDKVAGGSFTIRLDDGDEIFVPYDIRKNKKSSTGYSFYDGDQLVDNKYHQAHTVRLRSKSGIEYMISTWCDNGIYEVYVANDNGCC